MKNITLKLIAICLLFSITQGCKKDETIYNCYFYTSMMEMPGKLDLYIDDVNKGKLPSINAGILEFNDTLKSSALLLQMKSGKYEVKVKDDAGNLKVVSKISFSKTKSSTSGTMGGTGVSSRNNNIIIQLLY